MTMFNFLAPGHPHAPKSHPWGMTQASEQKPAQCILYLLFVRTYTKFGINIFVTDFVIVI